MTLSVTARFTEVQRYYDAGFTVPDDVTLLFCDNIWGYIRRKGTAAERKRKGGLGLYYHIDMNGGPWNDRWVNTTTLPKLREQLHEAYASGIDRIWIVNVGDLKPKEVPIDFMMSYAWNPDAILPTQDVYPSRGLRIGVQIDTQPLQIVDARQGFVDTFSEYTAENLAVSKVLKPLPCEAKLALNGWWRGRRLPMRNEVFDNQRWLTTVMPQAVGAGTPSA